MSSSGIDRGTAELRGPKEKVTAVPASVNDGSMPEFDPDYVIVVKHDKLIRENTLDVTKLLAEGGFYVTVTKGVGNTILVLVRITPQKLGQMAVELQSYDWARGVETPAVDLSNDGITPAGRERIVAATLLRLGVVPGKLRYVEATFPVSHRGVDKRLFRKALFHLVLGPEQVRLQYGDEVGLYFAFLQFSVAAMLFLAIAGIVSHFLPGFGGGIILGPFLVVWGALFVVLWRHKQRLLAIRWHTVNAGHIQTPRIGYRGSTAQSRQFKGLCFVLWAIYLCGIYVSALIGSLGYETFITQIYDGPYKKILGLSPTAVNVVLSQIFSLMYNISLTRFLNWEDYATDEEYDNVKTRRQFYAAFFLNYTPLLLSAYLYLPFGHLVVGYLGQIRASALGQRVPIVEQFHLDTKRLGTQTFYYAVTNQVILTITDTVLPLALNYLRELRHPEKGPFADIRRSQRLPPYSPNTDYLIAVSLFGYAVITAPIWPLAAVAVLVGLLVRVKASATKIAFETRRPVPRRVSTSGVWNSNLLFLAGVASVTTPTFTAMYGWASEDYGVSQSYVKVSAVAVLLLAFVSENTFLALVKLVERAADALPVPQQQPPVRQKEEGSIQLSPSDLHWEKHNVSQEIHAALS